MFRNFLVYLFVFVRYLSFATNWRLSCVFAAQREGISVKMFITDVKTDFYEYLKGKHCVIIVHHDIDAICSCRILQTLIKYNGVQYTLCPVRGKSDLKAAYLDNYEQIKCFVLINCGATIDLVEELDPPEDIVFFVLDSHRPTDVCNVYSTGQIRLVWTLEEDQNVPVFEDIFRDDDIEDEEGTQHISAGSEDEDSETEGRAAKRRRLGEQDILKRRERRLWEDKRDKLMFEYSQYSYYGKATALTLFELAHILAKDNKEILWWVILALTEQMLLGKIENVQYAMLAVKLQLQVDRIIKRSNSANVASSLKIKSEQDLKLYLYRHWTIEKSLRYSVFSTSKMRLWTRRGERRMQELFAEMGLPIAQTKQKFCAMDLVYRQEFFKTLEKSSEKYGLGGIIYPSFSVQYNYRNKFSAADMVFIMLCVLEQAPPSRTPDICFSDALDCLSKSSSPELLITGMDRAKQLFETCFKLMKVALDQRQIFSAGPFLYYIMYESTPDWYLYKHPHVLSILARYIQSGYCERFRMRNSEALPMIVSCPYDEETGTCIILGLPPMCEDSPKNFFGKAFEQAATRCQINMHTDYFNTSYTHLLLASRTSFFDALTALLS